MRLFVLTFRRAARPIARLVVLVGALVPIATFAQPAPEIVGSSRSLSLRSSIERELRSSPLHIGTMRATPIFELRNLGYDSNLFGTPENQTSDVTAALTAGARGIMPFGSKHFLRADSTAEYSWFAKEEDRRSWGWNVGGSFLGLFNRASFEATARTTNRLEPVSEEVDALFNRRTTIGLVGGEVRVLPRVALIGRLEADRYRHHGDEVTVGIRRLDRTDTSATVGVAYTMGRNLTMGVQTASYDSDFVDAPDREGSVYLATLRYEGNRLFVNSAAGRRNLDVDLPLAEGFDDITGSYFVSLRSLRGSSVEVFGRRGLEYSIAADTFYFLDLRNGAAGSLRLGDRAGVRLSAELGKNEYPQAIGSRGERTDDVRTLGAGVWIRLFRLSVLGIQVSQSDYDSNFPEFDRSIERVVLSFSLRGEPF